VIDQARQKRKIWEATRRPRASGWCAIWVI
jgi:hypothetical protein